MHAGRPACLAPACRPDAPGRGRRAAGRPDQRPALAAEQASHTAMPSTTETATFDELQEWHRPFMGLRAAAPLNLLPAAAADTRRRARPEG